MATGVEVQIAREKFYARTAQAALEAEVHRQGQLKADLARSIAQQAQMEAERKMTEAAKATESAMQDMRVAEAVMEHSKIDLLLEGFTAILGVFHNIEVVAAFLLGFLEKAVNSLDMTGADSRLKWAHWTAYFLGVASLVHCVFSAALAAVMSQRQAFCGSKGILDIKRAYHGLMEMRSPVFWDFFMGFIMYNVCVIGVLWIHLSHDESQGYKGLDSTDFTFGATVTFFASFIPSITLYCMHKKVRSLFKSEAASRIQEDISAGRTIDPFEFDVGPQSLRRWAKRQGLMDETSEYYMPRHSDSGSQRRLSPPPSPPASPSRRAYQQGGSIVHRAGAPTNSSARDTREWVDSLPTHNFHVQQGAIDTSGFDVIE